MKSRKILADVNLFLAIISLTFYIISLITITKISMLFLPVMSLTIILGGIITIKIVKPKFIGYLTLFTGVLLLVLSLNSLIRHY
ncbi:hypothetical protein CN946_01055 [Bacillus sp. AFS053548]|nr:hypothetical protein CN946_01055 [Bacillus sp. AFS053548]